MEKKLYNSEDFGTLIKTRRQNKKMTQKQLCSYIGVSTSFLSDLENGKPTIELDKALFVAKNLGLDLTLKSRDQ